MYSQPGTMIKVAKSARAKRISSRRRVAETRRMLDRQVNLGLFDKSNPLLALQECKESQNDRK